MRTQVLPYLLLTFFLSVSIQEAKAQCAGIESFTITPDFPVSGDCPPGQVYQFCYSMQGYTQSGANWVDGFEVQISPGWAPGSLTPLGAPATCDGSVGNWIWATTVVGSSTGQSNGPGYFFDRDNDGNAGNDFGDNSSTCTWTFCFELTVGNTPGQNLTVGVSALSDGAIGSWSSGDCGFNPPPIMAESCIVDVPCGTLTASVVQDETCPGDADGEVTSNMTNGTAPYAYSWNSVPVQNTAVATGLAAGSYTVTVTDGTGCVETATVVVSTGTAEDGTINPVNPLCTSDAPVQLTAVEPGGTFSGTGVSASGLFTPATAGAGTHTITYTTSGPCPDSQILDIVVVQDADATITDPFDPGNPTNTLCINDPDVQLNAVDAGGTWTGPGVSAGGLFSPLTAGVGVHNIAYDISPPCGDNDVIVITVTGATNATINNINPLNELCEDDAAVQLTTIEAGGVFSGTGVNATGLFDPAVSGVGIQTITYTITGNCSDVQTLDINVVLVADATINDVNVGNFVGIGDTPFQLNTIQPGGIFSGNGVSATGIFDPFAAGPGVHTITYTIADPCGDVQTIDITVTQVTFTATLTNVDCFGAATGEITVANETGQTPYQYSSDNGTSFQASNILTGLIAGTYDVVVMDDNGFLSSPVQVIISEPTALTITAQMDTESDCGQPNGTASALAQGGTVALNYAYSWDSMPVQLGPVATGLLPQFYTVTATDDNGCTVSTTINVTSTTDISVSIDPVVDPTCFGGCDGEATAIPGANAIAPLTYSWNDPLSQTTIIATGLCAGNVEVTLTDAAGCIATANATLNDPPEILVQVAATSTQLCIGESTDLTSNVIGGTAPYTYNWTALPTDPTLIASAQSPTVSPIMSTYYEVIWTDNQGCVSAPAGVSINVYDSLQLFTVSPTPLSTNDTAICPYDFATIELGASGGDGNYTFYLLPNQVDPAQLPLTVQPSEDTTYNFVVVDGCTTPPVFISSTITVHELPVVNFEGNVLAGCEPLNVTFTDATVPAPASLTWNFGDLGSNDNVTSVVQPTHQFAHPDSFDITLSVISVEGCVEEVSYSKYIAVHPLPVSDFNADPTQTNLLLANFGFYDHSSGNIVEWDWNFGDGEFSTMQDPRHVYNDTGSFVITLTVTTDMGCVDVYETQVIVDPDFMFYIPNSFTPNFDGHNDEFVPEGAGVDWDTFEMVIMNRWGNEVYHSANIEKGWNGSYEGYPAEAGVYVYRISVMDETEETKEYMGHVILLR